MSENWTLRRVIDWIQADFVRRGIDSARLEADLIVGHALSMKRIALYLDLDRPLVPGELAQIRALVERRRKREPMAYILGQREFYGRPFEVSKDVLIPRPDTETLVERALVRLAEGREGAVLDLCTGSGAVGITLALEQPERCIVVTDVSSAALDVARKNVARHGVDARVELREADLFDALKVDERFRCITINPPYIAEHELPGLEPDVRDFEPRLALAAGEDGLAFYRRIAQGAGAHMASGGVLLVEVGIGQAATVASLFRDAGLADVACYRDLAGVERVVEARQAAAP